MNYPKNYYFTREHEWINICDDVAQIGLTELALKELTRINQIEIQSIGRFLNKDQVFGRLKSVKYLCKLLMPFDGTIIEVNTEYCSSPSQINENYCHDHWMVKIKLMQPLDRSNLLTVDDYKTYKMNKLLHMVKYLLPLNAKEIE